MNREVWRWGLGTMGTGRGLGSWLRLRTMGMHRMDFNLMVSSNGVRTWS